MVSVQYSVRVEDRGLSKVETRTCISLPSEMQSTRSFSAMLQK